MNQTSTLREISSSEQAYIIEGCRQNCRQDGRRCQDSRTYYSNGGTTDSNNNNSDDAGDADPLVLSNGSARLFLPTGETNILVSVRAGLAVPSRARPKEGMIAIHVDLLHKTGQKRDEELESTLTELLVPHLMAKQDLCVVPHHYVWALYIDVLVLASHGGSLLDACGRAIQRALASTRIPIVTQMPSQGKDTDGSSGGGVSIEMDGDFKSANHIPGIQNPPVIQTVTILKGPNDRKPIFLLDATREEELCAMAQVHVVMEESTVQGEAGGAKTTTTTPARICALHKSGGGALPFSLLQDLTAFVAKSPTGSIKPATTGNGRITFETFMVAQ